MEFIPAKTILSGYAAENDWFGCNYNINLYKGCCHGCIYCDSRSDCYRVEHFDTVRAKKDALKLLRAELRAKAKSGVVGMGAMSDPYNPFEKELRLTRGALELFRANGYGVAIATKSALITRDIDVLQGIAAHSPVLCKVTVTTADDTLCAKIEPHVSRSSERLAAVKLLSDAGLFTGLLFMPMLPYLTDTQENVRAVVERAAESGARFLYFAPGMTLRANQRDHYYEKLDLLFPGLKEKYIRRYGDSYRCDVPQAKALWQTFTQACQTHGLLYRMPDIIRAYRSPYEQTQMRLF